MSCKGKGENIGSKLLALPSLIPLVLATLWPTQQKEGEGVLDFGPKVQQSTELNIPPN